MLVGGSGRSEKSLLDHFGSLSSFDVYVRDFSFVLESYIIARILGIINEMLKNAAPSKQITKFRSIVATGSWIRVKFSQTSCSYDSIWRWKFSFSEEKKIPKWRNFRRISEKSFSPSQCSVIACDFMHKSKVTWLRLHLNFLRFKKFNFNTILAPLTR